MGSDYEESDDEQYHKVLGLNKQSVDTLIHKRIARKKEKNGENEDEESLELEDNIFNPITFIIAELKAYQATKTK